MAWNEIIGLEREKKILEKALLEKRLASAYCFIGIEGVGKDAVALELAKVANCYNPIISLKEDENNLKYESIDACDECKSCKLARSFSHPNIQYVFALPVPASGKKEITDEQFELMKQQIALKSENKYHKISIPSANQINIIQIRDIKKKAALSSNKGRRFIIISNGDMMNPESANAFLKTLEEPHESTTIIITSSKKEKLLQTILSRCQQIYFNPITPDKIVEYLVQQHHKDKIESRLIASFSQGSISKAVESFDDNMNNMRSEAVDMLRIALKRKQYRIELTAAIENLLSKKDKKIYIVFLNLLLIWVRDVYTIATTKGTNLIINIDLADRMEKFHNGFPNADLLTSIHYIEQAINRIEHNVDPKLAIISLFLELRKIFLGVGY